MLNIAFVRMSWWTLLATLCSVSMLTLASAIISLPHRHCHHGSASMHEVHRSQHGENMAPASDPIVERTSERLGAGPCAVRCESTCSPGAAVAPNASESAVSEEPVPSTGSPEPPATSVGMPAVRKIDSHHVVIDRGHRERQTIVVDLAMTTNDHYAASAAPR